MKKFITNVRISSSRWLIMFIMLFICNSTYSQVASDNSFTTITPILSYNEIEQCKYNIIHSGSWEDYCLLSHQKIEIDSLVEYAVILANQYNNDQACFEVFRLTTLSYKKKNIEMDSNIISFALAYLEKGAGLGNQRCKKELHYLYSTGTYVEKDIEKAEKYQSTY